MEQGQRPAVGEAVPWKCQEAAPLGHGSRTSRGVQPLAVTAGPKGRCQEQPDALQELGGQYHPFRWAEHLEKRPLRPLLWFGKMPSAHHLPADGDLARAWPSGRT